jgi:UDP-2,3-diacylglucosamine pyrophosphatase LpxH
MRELTEDTLLVFVSDTHIGGDPGCDGFESPDELQGLLEELSGHEGPVELVLAGDFFDFLQISPPPAGVDRASLTVSRPEYRDLFAALRRFREGEGSRVVYLPGNHDAEGWWNPEIRETLSEEGLVDEFAFSYLASLEAGGERRVVYCEHGNQFDPANTVEDYNDPLDTPLGHHIVTDFTRRVAPFGEVARGLDLSEIKNVFPLVAIPQWVASRYFYNALGKVVVYLLLPILVLYALYRIASYLLLVGGFPGLSWVHHVFLDIAGFALLTAGIFGVFFLVVRHAVRRAVSGKRDLHYAPAEASREKIMACLRGESPPPMDPTVRPADIDVFVSGHTHLPALEEFRKQSGGPGVVVNSGCWLRQLQPVPPRIIGKPPLFVSRFVLTHVRVFAQDSSLRVELWEHPKRAGQRLTRIERLLKRRAPQPPPGAKPRVRKTAAL